MASISLIVDAAPIVGFANQDDPRSQVTDQLLSAFPGDLIMPAPVTTEIDYLLAKRFGKPAQHHFLTDLAVGLFQVETLTQSEHLLALQIHERYVDLDLGLADLSVIVLAQRFDTRRILTFDKRHFSAVEPLQGGSFQLLPADL